MGYPHDYPRLSNEQDFERLCLRLFRRHLQLDDLQLYGRRGQKQDGCDLVGVDGQGRVVGIQCKQREVHRPLTQEEVRAEVEKAKGFHPPLARYIIATSAPRDTKLQQLATQLTRSHRVEDLFHVTVMCWDDLQELLRDYPEVATHFYGITTDATDSNTTLPSVMKDESSRSDRCGGDEPSDLHAEIDEAAQHLTNRQPKIAVLLLHRLMKRQRHRLTSRCLYRVHANLGHCHIRMNEPETAASEYLKAKQQQPKDPEARRLEAHAYLLRAEREKARTLLSKLLQDEPEDARARALWIHSLPRDTPVADAEQAVPEAQRSSSEVALALATLAAARGAWREAEQKARTAVEHDPQWHEAKIQLAEVLLNRAQDVMDGVRARDSSSPTPTVQAREVVDLLTGVLSELENVAPASDLAPVWCSLAAAQWLLGKRTETDRYLEKAVAEAEHEPGVAVACAQLYYLLQRMDQAVALLRRMPEERRSFEVDLRLGQLLAERNGSGERAEARSLLVARKPEVERQPPSVQLLWLELLVKLHLSLDEIESARELADGPQAQQLDELPRRIFWSEIALAEGAHVEAKRLAREALKQTDATTSAFRIQAVARLLERLELFAEALEAWQQIVDVSVPSDALTRLVHCAQQCERWDVVVDACGQLRAAEYWIPRYIRAEVGAMERVSPQRTYDLLRNYPKTLIFADDHLWDLFSGRSHGWPGPNDRHGR